MGSTGSGHFSDYTNFQGSVKGVTGGSDALDRCEIAFSSMLEEVDSCEYVSKYGTIPPVNTIVILRLDVRIVVMAEDGTIIGYLPTEYNYLRNCMLNGYQYSGTVSVVGTSPVNTVMIDITPSRPK